MVIGAPKFIVCPRCKAKYDVSGFKSGKKFKCQGCSETLTVPAFAEPAPPPQAALQGPATRHVPLSRPPTRAYAPRTAPTGPNAPAERRTRRYVPQQSSNLPLLVSTIAALIIIVVAILFLTSDRKEENQQQNRGTTTVAGDTSQPLATAGTTTGTGGGTTPTHQPTASDSTSPSPTPEPKTQPTGPGSTPQPGTQPEQPPTPATPPQGGDTTTKRGEFIIDYSIKSDIDNLLAEMPHLSEEKIAEHSKVIEAYGDRAIPILIEALKHEDPMVANAASNLLRNITGYEDLDLKPGIAPEDALAIYELWKEWWCKHQFTYKRRKQERIDRMNAERFKAEVVRHLATYRHGTFSERLGAERKIKSLGTRVIPVLIELLGDENTDISTPAGRLLIKFTGQNIGKSDQEFGEMTPEQIEALKKQWEDWWESNSDTFKMPE